MSGFEMAMLAPTFTPSFQKEGEKGKVGPRLLPFKDISWKFYITFNGG